MSGNWTKLASLLTMLALAVLVSSCSGSLPDEAREALDSYIRDWYEISYTITSAQRATDPGQSDEAWCVVIEFTDAEVSHFILKRSELYWRVQNLLTDAFKPQFEYRGCDNW